MAEYIHNMNITYYHILINNWILLANGYYFYIIYLTLLMIFTFILFIDIYQLFYFIKAILIIEIIIIKIYMYCGLFLDYLLCLLRDIIARY